MAMASVTKSEDEDPFARAALGARTGYLLIKLGEVVWDIVEEALEPAGLKPRQFNVLASVSVHDGFSQRDLADLHNVDPNTIVALVDELESRGLVTRRRSQRDRRRHELTLTKQGRGALEEAFALIDAAEREFFAPLGKAEAKAFHAAVHRLLVPWWPPQRRQR